MKKSMFLAAGLGLVALSPAHSATMIANPNMAGAVSNALLSGFLTPQGMVTYFSDDTTDPVTFAHLLEPTLVVNNAPAAAPTNETTAASEIAPIAVLPSPVVGEAVTTDVSPVITPVLAAPVSAEVPIFVPMAEVDLTEAFIEPVFVAPAVIGVPEISPIALPVPTDVTSIVPEPSVGATLLAGFAMVGFGMRRKRSYAQSA